MKSINKMTQAELAAYVQSHLREKRITVVLSGGVCVSPYTANKYISVDIDLIDVYSVARNKIKTAMEEIGFNEKNRYFVHPDTKHIVEFPPGPLSVGEESVIKIKEIKSATGILRVISPTDCVKDRLAAYYFWNDQQSLAQALLVAEHHRINLTDIKKWPQASGNIKGFEIFLKKCSSKKRSR